MRGGRSVAMALRIGPYRSGVVRVRWEADEFIRSTLRVIVAHDFVEPWFT